MVRDVEMKRRRNGGFTLIEMMVVIVIIGLIASVAIQQYVSHAADAKVKVTQAMISDIGGAIDMFKLKHNVYPQDLRDLLRMPTYIDPAEWPSAGYLKRFPKDAWKSDFIYRTPGTGGQPYDLGSLGDDKLEGGDGRAKDLWNHEAFE